MNPAPKIDRLKAATPAAAGAGLAAAMALAIPVILHWEGTRNDVYKDVAAIPTVCVGHTGAEVRMGDRWDNDRCQRTLERDVKVHAEGIMRCISVSVPKESLAAFVSFSFNVGVDGFCRSSVARRVNSGDLAGACAGLSAWDKARVGGKLVQVRGLTRRRADERALCEKGLS